jgi:hypothetical protein
VEIKVNPLAEAFIILKIIHVVAGASALLSGALAIALRNKVKYHRVVGRVYFWSMLIVFLTSVYLGLARMNLFLICVGFFTFYMCVTAYRSLKLKKLPVQQKPHKIDWMIEGVFGLAHFIFVLLAVWFFIHQSYGAGFVGLIFGGFGLLGNYNTFRRFRHVQKHKNFWLLTHISGMLGSYIGAITAFVVNNSANIPLPPVVLWLGPTVLLTPLIILEVRKHSV